jgi:hypothetical protein
MRRVVVEEFVSSTCDEMRDVGPPCDGGRHRRSDGGTRPRRSCCIVRVVGFPAVSCIRQPGAQRSIASCMFMCMEQAISFLMLKSFILGLRGLGIDCFL